MKGISFLYFDNLPEALNDFNQVIKINPNDAYAYSLRADTYYELNNFKDAIKDYSNAIEIFPTNRPTVQ